MPQRKKVLKVDESISLHLPEVKMAQELYTVINQQRNYLGEWLVWVERTKTVKDVQVFLKEAGIFNRGGQRLITFIKYDGKIVGSLGFIKLDKPNKKGEIGYWLSKELQGKGIITKACEKLIEYAFQHLDLNRILIKMNAQNNKSKAIPRRMGFTYEGTLRQDRFRDNKFHDTEIFSLLKKEWIERNAVI